jgi:hypothetical protein
MFQGIEQLYHNAAFRQELVDKGRQQLSDEEKFPQSWNQVAESLLENLKDVVQRK